MSHKACLIPGVPQSRLAMGKTLPSCCTSAQGLWGWSQEAQWSNSIKAGLCAFFDEGCVKQHRDVVKFEGNIGGWKGYSATHTAADELNMISDPQSFIYLFIFLYRQAASFTWRMLYWSDVIHGETLIAVLRLPVFEGYSLYKEMTHWIICTVKSLVFVFNHKT